MGVSTTFLENKNEFLIGQEVNKWIYEVLVIEKNFSRLRTGISVKYVSMEGEMRFFFKSCF